MNNSVSSGHQLGQLIGDWFERDFVLPLLKKVAEDLGLYLDNRFIERNARGEKLIWEDLDGNKVDYDFVLELEGSDETIGIPVAFIESCWRRGSRHSKDKARDDSGKLRPMKATYPTARFLGMIVAGDFTQPARDLITNQGIDLFYAPKDKIVQAFQQSSLIIDYPDNLDENQKRKVADAFSIDFVDELKEKVATDLIEHLGVATITSYVDRVNAKLSALPQQVRLILRHDSKALAFDTLSEATIFLENPDFKMAEPIESFLYQVTYSDGSEFERVTWTVEELQDLHKQIVLLANHMNQINI